VNRTKSGESKFVYLLLDKSRTTRLADDTASPVQSRAETNAGSSGETVAGSSGRRNRGAESDDAEWTDV